MLKFIIENISLLLLASSAVVYAKVKDVCSVIYCLFITYLFFVGFDKILLLEISALFSVVYVIMQKSAFRRSGLFYISSVAIGCLMVALYENNLDFLTQIISTIIVKNDISAPETIINNLYLPIAVLLLLGLSPFAEWMLYVFSIMRTTPKIVFFLLPLFLSLNVHYDFLTHIDNYNDTKYIGWVISLYNIACLMFIRNIKTISSFIISFFYGLCMLTILTTKNNNAINYFVMVSLFVIFVCDFFTPKISLKYKIKNLHDIFLSNKLDIVLSIFSALIFFSLYLLNAFEELSSPYPQTYIVGVGFSFIFAKFFFYTKKKNYEQSHYVRSFTGLSLVKFCVMSLIICLFCYLSVFQQAQGEGTFINIFEKLKNKQCLLMLPIMFASFFSYSFLSKIDLPNSLQLTNYSKYSASFLSSLKIFTSIIGAITADFYVIIKNNLKELEKTDVFSKLSNILRDNYLYLYIFLLIQLIIVLTIECVIS